VNNVYHPQHKRRFYVRLHKVKKRFPVVKIYHHCRLVVNNQFIGDAKSICR